MNILINILKYLLFIASLSELIVNIRFISYITKPLNDQQFFTQFLKQHSKETQSYSLFHYHPFCHIPSAVFNLIVFLKKLSKIHSTNIFVNMLHCLFSISQSMIYIKTIISIKFCYSMILVPKELALNQGFG